MVQVVPYFLIVKSSIAYLTMSPPLRKCKSVYSQMRRYMERPEWFGLQFMNTTFEHCSLYGMVRGLVRATTNTRSTPTVLYARL